MKFFSRNAGIAVASSLVCLSALAAKPAASDQLRVISLDEMAAPAPADLGMPIPTGCPDFEIEAPRAHAGGVVRAVDFGFSESNRLNGAAIRRAVVEAKRTGAAKIVLAPGRYLCHDADGILIDGLADVTIDGAGATLVFYRPTRPSPSWNREDTTDHPITSFLLKDCQRVRFGNLKVDWDWTIDPLATLCRVADVHVGEPEDSSSYVDYEVVSPTPHPCYGKTIPIQTVVTMNEKGDGFDDVCSQYYSTYEGNTGAKSEWLAPNRIRVWPGVLPTAPDAIVGEHARNRYYSAEKNYWDVKHFLPHKGRLVRLAHHYYGKGAFLMDSCVNLTLHDIRIFSTFGMGFIVKGKQHHWALENCVIAPPPGERRAITVTADSLHAINSLGWAKITGFSSCLNQDDLWNFHDITSAAKRSGPRRLTFTHHRANPYFRATPGSSIELRQYNYEPTGIHVKVVRATDSELELDRDVPEAKYGSYILFNDDYATDHLLVRDCHFDGALGRGIFTGNDITVENCTFKNHMGIVFKFAAALMVTEWAEGHGTTNVVVRGCTFDNCQRMSRTTYAKTVADSFIGRNLRYSYKKDLDVPTWLGIVSGILFEKNTWINPRAPILHTLCAKDVLLRDNTIVMGDPRPGKNVSPRGEILAEHSENVHACDNRILYAAGDATAVVERQRLDAKIEPVPSLDPFAYEAKDGLLLRNGKPFYWIADGSDLGGIQASPIGLWLAKLQGTTWASVMHSTCHVYGSDTNGTACIAPRLPEAGFSWLREAIRLGFLTQCPEGFYAFENETLSPTLVKHPGLLQALYDHGHHMGADPGSALGLATLDAKRYPLFAYGEKTGYFLPELNREPGPDPYNERVRCGFRAWAAKKYGTLAEANRVWKTSFQTWDDVILRHVAEGGIDVSCLTNVGYKANRPVVLQRRNRRSEMRGEERRTIPELYWDWMLYVQEDTTAATEREFASARRYAPTSLIGSDIRGHQSSRDNYVAYDPLVVDRLADVYYVHSSGYRCYDYGRRPYDPTTLHDAMCWPLFTARYFRCNTTKPILNSEDIIHHTTAAGVTQDAMAANDLAKFAEVPFAMTPAPEGRVSFSAKFSLPPRYEADRQDGSRRFFLTGVSPAQIRWFSINGKAVGYVSSPGRFYKFDVTDLLHFDKPNKITGGFGRISGTAPKNPGCHILPGDMLGEQSDYGEKQYTSQYWNYLMGGHSGVIVWHWQNHDRLRLYQAALTKRLEVAAEVVLPDVRFRREKVAYLYSYNAGIGLPAMVEGRHHALMDWAGALEFTGHRYDVLGEERFRERGSSYDVVVAPDIWCCDAKTIAAAKAYVRGGGTLVITPGSLGKTFTRYADSGFAAFAAQATGKGRVVTVEKGLSMPQLAEKLAPLLPKPELDVEILPAEGVTAKEFPCIERVLAGDATRKVLYLHNWGGLDHRVRVNLPAALKGWTLTPLEGAWNAAEVSAVVEGSQGVAVCLLTAPGVPVPALTLPVKEQARIEHVRDLMTFNRPAPGKKRVLFALDVADEPSASYAGAELHPHLIEAVRACGAEADAVPPSKWTPELLSKYAAVVITEGHHRLWQEFLKKKKTQTMLQNYVQGGGSLFADIYTARMSCCNASFFWYNAKICPAKLAGGEVARDDVSYGFGDPRQVLTDNVKPHPVSEGVSKVQLYALTPMVYGNSGKLQTVLALPKTSTHPDAPVLSVSELKKGRFAACVDPMAFQPYRIGEADNAALLLNLMGWLLRTPVTAEDRAAFAARVRAF